MAISKIRGDQPQTVSGLIKMVKDSKNQDMTEELPLTSYYEARGLVEKLTTEEGKNYVMWKLVHALYMYEKYPDKYPDKKSWVFNPEDIKRAVAYISTLNFSTPVRIANFIGSSTAMDFGIVSDQLRTLQHQVAIVATNHELTEEAVDVFMKSRNYLDGSLFFRDKDKKIAKRFYNLALQSAKDEGGDSLEGMMILASLLKNRKDLKNLQKQFQAQRLGTEKDEKEEDSDSSETPLLDFSEFWVKDTEIDKKRKEMKQKEGTIEQRKFYEETLDYYKKQRQFYAAAKLSEEFGYPYNAEFFYKKEILSRGAYSVSALEKLTILLLKEQKNEEAFEITRKLYEIELNPSNPKMHRNLLLSSSDRLGNLIEETKDFQRGISIWEYILNSYRPKVEQVEEKDNVFGSRWDAMRCFSEASKFFRERGYLEISQKLCEEAIDLCEEMNNPNSLSEAIKLSEKAKNDKKAIELKGRYLNLLNDNKLDISPKFWDLCLELGEFKLGRERAEKYGCYNHASEFSKLMGDNEMLQVYDRLDNLLKTHYTF